MTGSANRQARVVGVGWAAGLGLVVAAACSGALTPVLFAQPTTAKWFSLVVASSLLISVVVSPRRVTYLTMLAVAVAPFTALVYTVHGLEVPFECVFVAVAVIFAWLARDKQNFAGGRQGSSNLARGSFLAACMLVPAVVLGLEAWSLALQATLVAGLGYTIVRTLRLDPYGPVLITVAFSLSLSLQGILALNEYRTGHTFNPYGTGVSSYSDTYFFGYEGAFRPSGAFGDPVSLGNVLAAGVPLAFAASATRTIHFVLRIVFAVCCVAMICGLILTLSRMSWIGATVGVTAVVLLGGKGNRIRPLLSVVATLVACLVLTVGFAGQQLLLRFRSIGDPTAQGVSTAEGDETRKAIWASALDVFRQHPLFGVGFGNLNPLLQDTVGGAGIYTHAHSTYIQLLAEAGILGGGAILVIATVATLSVRQALSRQGKSRFLILGSTGAMASLAVSWTTDYTVRYTAVLLCMAVPFAIVVGARNLSPGASLMVGPRANLVPVKRWQAARPGFFNPAPAPLANDPTLANTAGASDY